MAACGEIEVAVCSADSELVADASGGKTEPEVGEEGCEDVTSVYSSCIVIVDMVWVYPCGTDSGLSAEVPDG